MQHDLRYDTFVIDLDGTLLRPDGSVSDTNALAVERAREAGLEVIVATGRALVESLAPLGAIGHEGTMVAAGGAMVCDVATGRTVDRHAMPHDLVADVVSTLLAHGHKGLLLKDPDVTGYDYLAVGPADLDPASQWWFETLPVRVRFAHDLDDDPHPHETLRAGAVASERELVPIAMWLRESIGDRGFLQHWSAVTATEATGSNTHLLEVFNPRVNKGNTTLDLCRQRGVPPERVAAIGDGLNDVELVRDAGLGIAMGNADERVLAVADRVATDNVSDGVAGAIDAVLSGAW
ncbi:MAG: HAD family hydrolase [Planctomycetes bacterium]|nr:HAD family hydrolase [Planctomycetota bacterium]